MQKKLIMHVNYGGEYLSSFWKKTFILFITWKKSRVRNCELNAIFYPDANPD